MRKRVTPPQVGDRFGALTAVCPEPRRLRALMWRYRCDCGNEVVRRVCTIGGRLHSCGCKLGAQRDPRPMAERIRERCGAEGECLVWRGQVNRKGYGTISAGGSGCKVYTHRAMYEALVGPIPEGLEIDHLCRNTRCCNPNHLEPVTHSENMRRMHVARRS